jgi:hypothetical protein
MTHFTEVVDLGTRIEQELDGVGMAPSRCKYEG